MRINVFDWRGPPELFAAGSISDHERRLIAAFALQRLETARQQMARTRLADHALGKSL